MSKSIVSFIKRLEVNNSKQLYGQLYKIRSEYIRNNEAIVRLERTTCHVNPLFTFSFQELLTNAKGIKKLVDIVEASMKQDASEENDKILEVALSILGNCTCNNEAAGEQVRKKNLNLV